MKKKRRLPSNDWLFGVCSTNLGRGLNPIPSWHCGCSERVDYVDFWHSTFFFHDCQPVALPLDYLQRPKKKYSNCHQNLIHFFSFLSTALPRHVLSLCERPTGSRVTDCTSVPRRTGFLRSTRMNRGAAVHFCSDCVSSSPHGDSSTTASSWLVPTDWLQTTELTDHWIFRVPFSFRTVLATKHDTSDWFLTQTTVQWGPWAFTNRRSNSYGRPKEEEWSRERKKKY